MQNVLNMTRTPFGSDYSQGKRLKKRKKIKTLFWTFPLRIINSTPFTYLTRMRQAQVVHWLRDEFTLHFLSAKIFYVFLCFWGRWLRQKYLFGSKVGRGGYFWLFWPFSTVFGYIKLLFTVNSILTRKLRIY